jgi:tRNA threonylcarbamoyladenosine biosynthesis protein TsaE
MGLYSGQKRPFFNAKSSKFGHLLKWLSCWLHSSRLAIQQVNGFGSSCRMTELKIDSEEKMLELGASLVLAFSVGDAVLFEGELGAGKTTLIRGMLRGLGWNDAVRSPTYNLFAVYSTSPPVLHADFYRVTGTAGTGVEDYLDSHLCLIEWPKAIHDLIDLDSAKRIQIFIEGDGRRVQLSNISL